MPEDTPQSDSEAPPWTCRHSPPKVHLAAESLALDVRCHGRASRACVHAMLAKTKVRPSPPCAAALRPCRAPRPSRRPAHSRGRRRPGARRAEAAQRRRSVGTMAPPAGPVATDGNRNRCRGYHRHDVKKIDISTHTAQRGVPPWQMRGAWRLRQCWDVRIVQLFFTIGSSS